MQNKGPSRVGCESWAEPPGKTQGAIVDRASRVRENVNLNGWCRCRGHSGDFFGSAGGLGSTSVLFSVAGWMLLGMILGAGAALAIAFRGNRGATRSDRTSVAGLIQSHFHPTPLSEITISERRFPFRVRADLQRAIDRLFGAGTDIAHFCGVRKE